MSARLTYHGYGKTGVRLLKVIRHDDRHAVREITAAITLEGDFDTACTGGDNARVLPTDTMKNTVYALGKDHPLESIETFALHLAEHFVASHPPVAAARVDIEETRWEPLQVRGTPHPTAFSRQGGELRTCTAVAARQAAPRVSAGLRGLVLLKTADSAFSGFPRDRYTTLKETEDRLLGTSVTATWDYARAGVDFGACRAAAVAALIETFAEHHSRSVQHTLYAMGERMLAACAEIERVHLVLPNKHCLLVDLAPFGQDNPNEVFLPIEEPSGRIEATIAR